MAEIGALIEGGKATAGAPLGPALGPLGVNIGQVVAKINEKTKDFTGMKVPITVVVDDSTKEFEIEVGSPPTSALIKKEMEVEKGAGKVADGVCGDLKLEQAVKVAKMKFDALKTPSLKNAVKQVVGSCVSIGCTVEGKDPREIIKEINEGKHDSVITE
ncbi:MAG: 50S ribosomal protein L11 [Candidatus Diapherotrites archaeon]|nr:50S ribosomal protein L11 [Candidatus Diapherotrites archaeon]